VVLLFVLASEFVEAELWPLEGRLEPEVDPEVDPEVEPVLVAGALEPPAALEALSFDLDLVEPLEASLSFLCFFSPLCLPLFVCVRPFASLDTFGLSDVVAPAPALVEPLPVLPPVTLASFELEPLVPALVPLLMPLVLPLFVLVPAPVPTLAFPLAFVSVCALVLWAAASWLNDTASKPEKSTGKNLRIEKSSGG
jgi:hypothetical protein